MGLVGSLIKWIKVQHYRFEINFGFYVLTRAEALVLYFIFLFISYIISRYTYAFVTQFLNLITTK